MPGFNGTGPSGAGPMTGRGMGRCGYGASRGAGRGWFGRGFRRIGQGLGYGFRRPWTKAEEKEALDEEEGVLKEELARIQEDKKALKK